MKNLILALFLCLTSSAVYAAKKVPNDINLIRVYKSERRLELVNRGNYVIKSYKIMLGGNPVGHKTQEGDGKTPEGAYMLDTKNPNSKFYKSLHVSYPNAQDKARARARNVNPGGDIMIHGIPNSFAEFSKTMNTIGLGGMSDDVIQSVISNFDWTNGCIALLNNDVREVYNIIDVPTKIVIYP
jgi:murein L,D-transpeptidase YafK